MKAAVITFPGSNREGDVAKALVQAGATVAHVWHADTALRAPSVLRRSPYRVWVARHRSETKGDHGHRPATIAW